ncbi:MAG: hypothetical protein ACYTKD_22725 [Planctomycetota bacterium]
MSRNVQLVLVCEDQQHEVFVRRFLRRAGWDNRRLRVERVPPPRGSAESFVRERFPVELSAYRSRRNQVGQALIVMVDGDRQGVKARLGQFADACRSKGMQPRQGDERVAAFVPTWNIETWLAYLDGETVDEHRKDYPHLARRRDCQRHVDRLHEMCNRDALAPSPPASLEAACEEYRQRLQP